MRSRPGRVFAEIEAALPRPRDRQSAAFYLVKRRVRSSAPASPTTAKPVRARGPRSGGADLSGPFTSLYLSRDGADGPRRQVTAARPATAMFGRRPK
jgi:hypothetical protein